MSLKCCQCSNLMMQARPVDAIVGSSPLLRRASSILVSMLGDGYAIMRRDVYCRHGHLPSKFGVHRAPSLEVSSCDDPDIDPASSQSFPHEPSCWVGGKMLSLHQTLALSDALMGVRNSGRGAVTDVLRSYGVVVR